MTSLLYERRYSARNPVITQTLKAAATETGERLFSNLPNHYLVITIKIFLLPARNLMEQRFIF
jgi:hypothetical protein